MVFTKIVLRLGQHSPGSTSRVKELPHGPRCGKQAVILHEENVHHEPDHLPRLEVIAGCLVHQLVEASNEIFEDQPHLLVRAYLRMEIHITELRDDQIQDIRLPHLLDLVLKLEIIEDSTDVG